MTISVGRNAPLVWGALAIIVNTASWGVLLIFGHVWCKIMAGIQRQRSTKTSLLLHFIDHLCFSKYFIPSKKQSRQLQVDLTFFETLSGRGLGHVAGPCRCRKLLFLNIHKKCLTCSCTKTRRSSAVTATGQEVYHTQGCVMSRVYTGD